VSVEHRAHFAEIAARKAFDEFSLVEIVVNFAIDEVLEFVGAREIVDGDDALFAALVERLHEIAADKAGRAGDDDSHGRSAVMSFNWR
jgi:predicted HAD superfamily Cof-like phosphohydrolase